MGSKKSVTVRRVVSRFEETVCEAPAAHVVCGERANGPKLVAELVAPLLEDEAVEVLAVLFLDGKHQAIGFAEVSRGTLTATLVHPREVFGPALRVGCAAIIVVHNHPSGDPEPSREDIAVTNRLVEVGELVGVPVLDHIIVAGKGKFTSIRERTRFP